VEKVIKVFRAFKENKVSRVLVQELVQFLLELLFTLQETMEVLVVLLFLVVT
tara:strand:+ start:629 stop:784 length:156 start_codon:yes stop_codon:yes gene_type:complete